MENKSLPIDRNRESGNELAYRLAREQLAGIKDIEQQCLNSGARCLDSRKIAIDYLDQPYLVTLPDGEVSPAAVGGTVSIREKILIIHYLTQAKGTPPAGRVIAYQELPGAGIYVPVFTKRAINPIVDNFGGEPQRLLEVAAALGGRRADYGDAAVTINAFPHVPVTIVLWRGDDEFPPNGNIMFDGSISDYLTTDDTNVMCETIAWRLVKLKAAGDKSVKS